MDPDPKRPQTEAAAAIPTDTAATTPMGKAKATIQASVEWLRPELASILTRLGNEYITGEKKALFSLFSSFGKRVSP